MYVPTWEDLMLTMGSLFNKYVTLIIKNKSKMLRNNKKKFLFIIYIQFKSILILPQSILVLNTFYQVLMYRFLTLLSN